MAGPIIVSGQEAGTNTDILQGTRLQTVPSNGMLTFELQASDNAAANHYTASIELPSGDTPLNDVLMPAGPDAGVPGVIDSRVDLQASFRVGQGGHSTLSCIETGDTEFTWRVTFSPF